MTVAFFVRTTEPRRSTISPAEILPSIAGPLRSATMDTWFSKSMNRLRKFRKTVHLTQREVATLVGYASQRAYSDMELGLKRPGLGTALACCVLFKASPAELFPDLAEYVERALLARARKLQQLLGSDGDREIATAHIAKLIEDLDE